MEIIKIVSLFIKIYIIYVEFYIDSMYTLNEIVYIYIIIQTSVLHYDLDHIIIKIIWIYSEKLNIIYKIISSFAVIAQNQKATDLTLNTNIIRIEILF